MPRITLQNIPEDLHRRLRQRATQHGHDLDHEILACLERTLDQDALLDRIRERRTRMKVDGLHLKEADVRSAIEEGRP